MSAKKKVQKHSGNVTCITGALHILTKTDTCVSHLNTHTFQYRGSLNTLDSWRVEEWGRCYIWVLFPLSNTTIYKQLAHISLSITEFTASTMLQHLLVHEAIIRRNINKPYTTELCFLHGSKERKVPRGSCSLRSSTSFIAGDSHPHRIANTESTDKALQILNLRALWSALTSPKVC